MIVALGCSGIAGLALTPGLELMKTAQTLD
jgi:hypothetical protein